MVTGVSRCQNSRMYQTPSSSSQGVTFRVEKDDLVIARILHGGMIDRQGLLHVGDIIKEVNGKDVGNNPTELQEMLKDCSGGITLKILPSYRDAPAPPQVNISQYPMTWYCKHKQTSTHVMSGRCWALAPGWWCVLRPSHNPLHRNVNPGSPINNTPHAI